jgi:hypothetical protein
MDVGTAAPHDEIRFIVAPTPIKVAHPWFRQVNDNIYLRLSEITWPPLSDALRDASEWCIHLHSWPLWYSMKPFNLANKTSVSIDQKKEKTELYWTETSFTQNHTELEDNERLTAHQRLDRDKSCQRERARDITHSMSWITAMMRSGLGLCSIPQTGSVCMWCVFAWAYECVRARLCEYGPRSYSSNLAAHWLTSHPPSEGIMG